MKFTFVFRDVLSTIILHDTTSQKTNLNFKKNALYNHTSATSKTPRRTTCVLAVRDHWLPGNRLQAAAAGGERPELRKRVSAGAKRGATGVTTPNPLIYT
jgi:hypothetical protein